MIILYDNNVYDATSIAGTIDAYGDEALVEPRLSSVAITDGLSSQYIVFSHTSAVAVAYACLYGTNLTSGATVKLEGNSSDSWSTPAVSLTLSYAEKAGTFLGSMASASYAYWRLTITDSGNSDSELTIPWFFYGIALTMPGMDLGQTLSRASNALSKKSAAGQLYGGKKLKPKSAEIVFNDIEDSEKKDIETFIDYCDITHPFIILVWENDLDVEPPIFVSLNELPTWKRNTGHGLLWNMSLKMEECF